MKYEKLGLVNTQEIFANALTQHYAIPAFNFYNMETLTAILDAAHLTHSPIILAVSESALQYMGPDMLIGMIAGAKIHPSNKVVLHLDHGHSFKSCQTAIKLGFSSVMIDASNLPFEENIKITKQVAEFAHKHNVSVESELGTLSGFEDDNTNNHQSCFTNPDDVTKFVSETGTDSLAISIGTSHGPHKRKRHDEKLRFDILSDIASRMPNLPLVLHGASTIPQKLISNINEYGGKILGANGIDESQLRQAAKMNICKINIDSDLRIAFMAATRQSLHNTPSSINPRDFLMQSRQKMTQLCIDEIINIMGSDNKISS